MFRTVFCKESEARELRRFGAVSGIFPYWNSRVTAEDTGNTAFPESV